MPHGTLFIKDLHWKAKNFATLTTCRLRFRGQDSQFQVRSDCVYCLNRSLSLKLWVDALNNEKVVVAPSPNNEKITAKSGWHCCQLCRQFSVTPSDVCLHKSATSRHQLPRSHCTVFGGNSAVAPGWRCYSRQWREAGASILTRKPYFFPTAFPAHFNA